MRLADAKGYAKRPRRGKGEYIFSREFTKEAQQKALNSQSNQRKRPRLEQQDNVNEGGTLGMTDWLRNSFLQKVAFLCLENKNR